MSDITQSRAPRSSTYLMVTFLLFIFGSALNYWNDFSSPRPTMSHWREFRDFGFIPVATVIIFAAYWLQRRAEKVQR